MAGITQAKPKTSGRNSGLNKSQVKGGRGIPRISNKSMLTRLSVYLIIEALIHAAYIYVGGPKLNNFADGMAGYEGIPPEQARRAGLCGLQ